MGAGKNAPLSGEPIVRMMESKGVCDMKKPRYYITLNSEETRLVLRSLIRMKNRLNQHSQPERDTPLLHAVPMADHAGQIGLREAHTGGI